MDEERGREGSEREAPESAESVPGDSVREGGSGDLTGRLVVVTGVGRAGQVGDAVARAFARRGARVALLGRVAGEVQARAGELRADGLVATAHAGDLSDAGTAEQLAREVFSAHPGAGGAMYALVNAAGGFGMTGPLDQSDPAEWRRQFSMGVDTAYAATRAFLPALRAGRGAVVYFTSAAALQGARVGGMAGYAGAKSAVIALMRSVADDERRHGVRANAVAPGAIRTAANVEAMGEKESYTALETVAAVVGFLCAEEVTGQVVGV